MRQIVNISKDDNLAMFTRAMDFLKKTWKFKETNSKTFFHKLIKWFVNRRLANIWEFIIHKIHESRTLCNSR
jgi:hypothetical protein